MRGVVVAVILFAARVSHAEPPCNELAVQAGVLPGGSLVGVEYARVAHRYLELAADVSYGLGSNLSVMPRFRVPLHHSTVALGAGPSLVYDSFFDKPGRWYGELLADVEVTHVSPDGWLVQARLGIAFARPETLPFLGIGVGRAL